jgi:hypothetical protein
MKYIFTLLSVAACTSLFISCDKDSKCEDNGSPVVTANTQVATGEPISLAVEGVDNVSMYKWSGPNNFSSKEQCPVIENATPYSSGVYTVDVITNDGCIMRSYSDSIEVTGQLPICYLRKNTGIFSIALPISFYSVSRDRSDNWIEFEAYSNDGRLTLSIFPRNNELAPGLYDIVDNYSDAKGGQAMISFLYFSQTLKAKGGKLTVRIEGGKYVVECCEIPFTSDKTTGDVIGSISLLED